MYKGTTSAKTFHDRVASDSTKGYGTGRVDVLPPEARPWAEIFLSLRDQMAIAVKNLDAEKNKLDQVNRQLESTLPRLQFEHLARLRAHLARQVEHHAGIVSALRRDADTAAQQSFGLCFVKCARAMLLPEQFEAIREAANELDGGKKDLPRPEYREARSAAETAQAKAVRRRLQDMRHPRMSHQAEMNIAAYRSYRHQR